MKSILFCLLVLSAITVGASDAPLGEEAARHLLTRTGFGATAAEIATFAPLGREAAADKLLNGFTGNSVTTPPDWVTDSDIRRKGDSDDDRASFRQLQRERGIEIRQWWYTEMMTTPSPFTEKMTLFWHNHFVSSQQKVKLAVLMYRQNAVFRSQALGNFGELLHQISRDPAMLIYLDGVQNRAGAPNENFAREVMELFTLGEGHYTENDIREAARALTGMSLDKSDLSYVFRPRQHDDGSKTIFGKQGNFGPDEFLDLILQKPETAEFITRKLWREFVSPTPDEHEIQRLASIFRDKNYAIKPLMRAMLTSDAFYAPQNRGVLIKSPVELIVGTFHTFGIDPPNWKPVLFVAGALGQDLFGPPNVKGWPGYTDWINSQRLLTRKQLLARIFRVNDAGVTMTADPVQSDKQDKALMRATGGKRGIDLYLDRWIDSVGGLGRASMIMLPIRPDSVPDGNPADVVAQLAMNPLYQLK